MADLRSSYSLTIDNRLNKYNKYLIIRLVSNSGEAGLNKALNCLKCV